MDTVAYLHPRVAQFIRNACIPARLKVKESQRLAEDYLVSWTPKVVTTDERGRVHYRVEGYLPPEDFVARPSLGAGKYWLGRKQFGQTKRRFEEMARRHPSTDAGAEALYWLGVAGYKESHDLAQLQTSWQRLTQEYPNSAWAERTRIPAAT